MSEETLLTITVGHDGSYKITGPKNERLEVMHPDKLEGLVGQQIKKAKVIPELSMTILESNPIWICIGGNWIRIG